MTAVARHGLLYGRTANGSRAVIHDSLTNIIRAVLSQREPRDAAVNFDRCRILQRHRAVSLPQHGFLVQAYISDRSNTEITKKYADFHGRDTKSRR